jgi:hypothetical protein
MPRRHTPEQQRARYWRDPARARERKRHQRERKRLAEYFAELARQGIAAQGARRAELREVRGVRDTSGLVCARCAMRWRDPSSTWCEVCRRRARESRMGRAILEQWERQVQPKKKGPPTRR